MEKKFRKPTNSIPAGTDFDIDSGKRNENTEKTMPIPFDLYKHLCLLGIIDNTGTRCYNIGESDYARHVIQPWAVWADNPNLTAWDCDIIKRVLRYKKVSGKSDIQSRIEDYRKIAHNCQERIRQLEILEKL